MSIEHIEDLGITDFLNAVRNIAKMRATEKLDGANLWFGLDENGELFTSRAGKRAGAENFYSESEYPYFAAYNGFRAAHAALELVLTDIDSVLEPGDTVELEILYGRQPNAVTYGLDGKNFIAILRSVNETPQEKADKLAEILNNKEVTVNTEVVDTTDGVNLEHKKVEQVFKFVGVQKIESKDLESIDVTDSVDELQKFLDTRSTVSGLSNFELMTQSLTSVPKGERAAAKEAKDEILAKVKTKFKVKIKKELLDKFVSTIKSPLASGDLSGDEDNGIEGVVLVDPETGKQIKIVDKDNFTTINQFNFAVRNSIAGMVRTVDNNASIEARGGIVGVMRIRIADLLGNKNLAIGKVAKNIFTNNAGANANETIRNLAGTLNGSDFIGVKKKIQAIVAATIKDLDARLVEFKKNKESAGAYKLKLKSGKSMGLSPEIVKRTLMTFAETRRNLQELLLKVRGATTFEELIGELYGRAIRASSEDGQVNEELLIEAKRNYTDTTRYSSVKDGFDLLNIYIATVMMSVLMYKAEDKMGMKLLRDKPHYRMTKWEPDMSPLNFWGYVIWRSGTPAVEKILGKKKAAEIFKVVRKVPTAWSRYLHMDLSFARDVPIDWQDHYKTIKRLEQYPSINSDRLNTLLSNTFAYDTLTLDEKAKFLPKLYFFATQFVPTSPLLPRVRVIQDNMLLNANGENDEMVVKESLLKQIIAEDDGPTDPASAPVDSAGSQSAMSQQSTTAKDIATKQSPIGRGAMIVRRKRNPSIKRKRFERPKD